MKKLFALFAIAAVTVLAQSAPSFTVQQGTALAATRPCSGSQNVGSIYTQITNPSITWVCSQIGSNALGNGAYGWVSALTGTGGTGVYVTLTGTQTLTNKTLTAPTLTTPALGAATGASVAITGSYTSTLATGTAPLVITSTTPVAHLTSQVLAYNAAGTQQLESKAVFGTCTLGTSCVVTFAGSAAWTSSSSYRCSATDQTTAAATKVVNDSASQATFTGTSTDVLSFVCIGN